MITRSMEFPEPINSVGSLFVIARVLQGYSEEVDILE